MFADIKYANSSISSGISLIYLPIIIFPKQPTNNQSHIDKKAIAFISHHGLVLFIITH
jgi:hypothetical protein